MPLHQRTDFGDARFAGQEVAFSCDVNETLDAALASNFDFVVLPLVHPRFRRTAVAAGLSGLPFTRSDLLLTSSQWSGQIVGKVSQWIRPDSAQARVRADSEAALSQELSWAAHLSLQAVIVPLPPVSSNVNYARTLNKALLGLTTMAVWVRIPLLVAQAPAEEQEEWPRVNGVSAAEGEEKESKEERHAEGPSSSAAASKAAPQDPWERWNAVRCLCEHSARLGVVLDVPAVLPPGLDLVRWRGEAVRAVVIPTGAFATNKRGYPTLPRAHQELLLHFWRLGVQVILSGQPQHQPPPPSPALPSAPSPAAKSSAAVVATAGPQGSVHAAPRGASLRLYSEYLSYLFAKPDGPSPEEAQELSYRDYLQAPLQPLQDNLESQTYETFERDSTKYSQYQAAIAAALSDREAGSEGSDRDAIIMVVGSGRGPLVRASLQAAQQAQRRVRVYAVEKNPNAVVTLQNLVLSEGWSEQVQVVFADMRHWQAPEKADIMVSELLGSFGDNELSPECLDGAQRHLGPQGISIPCDYTSYLQPITSAKLWNEVKAYGDLEHLETPYVVKLHRYSPLSEPQPVFTFRHPNHSGGEGGLPDNNRALSLSFPRPGSAAALCHGFAGFFEATLYGEVTLSTLPSTHTPGMFSWFPIYFPLRDPIYCAPGAAVDAHMWRCCTSHKVWYEWALSSPALTSIANAGGRSYYVGL